MADLAGRWDCTVESPMGDQQFTLTVIPDGDRFSGEASGGIGTRTIEDGAIDGDELAWSMAVAKPMPITVTCRATVDGDILEGTVKAGIFGKFPITGRRAG